MKIKTSELIGAALDWAVAKCAGREIDGFGRYGVVVWELDALTGDKEACCLFTPSTDWAQGGPIIDRESISTIRLDDDFEVDAKGYCTNKRTPVWGATTGQHTVYNDHDNGLVYVDDMVEGPTPLIAAMRYYCCAKLGDEIDIPQELQPCQQPNS